MHYKFSVKDLRIHATDSTMKKAGKTFVFPAFSALRRSLLANYSE